MEQNEINHLKWLADRLVYVYKESPNVDFVLALKRIIECHAQPASDDEKRSKGIGQALLNGPLDSADLTQLHRNSKAMLHLLYEQSHQIKDLQQTTKFLAQQVKTLVDALAEDQDPDMPVTSYLSGKPI